jgi:hypothetical protein
MPTSAAENPAMSPLLHGEFGNSVTPMLPACLQHGIWPISFLLLLRLDVHVDGDLVMSKGCLGK